MTALEQVTPETGTAANVISWEQIGHALLAEGLIQNSDAQRFFFQETKVNSTPFNLLIRSGSLSEDVLSRFLARFFGLPLLTQEDLPENIGSYIEWLAALPVRIEWWQNQDAILWSDHADQLWLVSKHFFDASVVEAAGKIFPSDNTPITLGILSPQVIEHFWENVESYLKQHKNSTFSPGSDEASYLRELAEEAPVIEYVNNLFAQGIEKRASDIHIDPQKKQLFIHLRIDGILIQHARLPLERFSAIASRLKLIANMDIAEKRRPQDGRIQVRVSGSEYDVRISTLPSLHGESIVMRLLPTNQQELQLDKLGMLPDQLDLFKQLIHQPHGVILVTGPTGSGKSTTLYSALTIINDGQKKIITIEDPVEYSMEGVTQIQVNSDINLTFASVLRSSLRQDPDVILVGEIRDLETAQIAIQASLTGHLVLSTLHTNSSIEAFTRLVDMGVDPFLVATPLTGVMAQRLARKLCLNCAIPDEHFPVNINQEITKYLPDKLVNKAPQYLKAQGCKLCNYTGYKGRIGIFELVPMSEELREMILQKESNSKMWSFIHQQGFRNLRQDGLVKVWRGLTSLDEILRITSS